MNTQHVRWSGREIWICPDMWGACQMCSRLRFLEHVWLDSELVGFSLKVRLLGDQFG